MNFYFENKQQFDEGMELIAKHTTIKWCVGEEPNKLGARDLRNIKNHFDKGRFIKVDIYRENQLGYSESKPEYLEGVPKFTKDLLNRGALACSARNYYGK